MLPRAVWKIRPSGTVPNLFMCARSTGLCLPDDEQVMRANRRSALLQGSAEPASAPRPGRSGSGGRAGADYRQTEDGATGEGGELASVITRA